MKEVFRVYVIVFILLSFFFFGAFAFAQEEQKVEVNATPQIQQEAPKAEAPPAETAPPKSEEPAAQWVWGEVISTDTNAGQIQLKYLDYETDNEKEITIATDAKTVYENVAALSEIKTKDTVSIDYVVGSDGKNIAKKISVEKVENAPSEATAPEPLAPSVPESSQ